MFTKLIFLSPRSTPPIYVRSRPQASARASCEIPVVFRRARMRSPNRFLTCEERTLSMGRMESLWMTISPRTLSSTTAESQYRTDTAALCSERLLSLVLLRPICLSWRPSATLAGRSGDPASLRREGKRKLTRVCGGNFRRLPPGADREGRSGRLGS